MRDTKFYKTIQKWIKALKPSSWLPKLKESKFGKGWTKLIQTLKPMTWPQRLDFLWTYYKDIILFVGILVFVPIVLIFSFANKKDCIFGGKFVNLDVRKAGLAYITDEYFEKLGGDPKTQEIQVGPIVFDKYSAEPEYNFNIAMSVMGSIEAEVLDYMILDAYSMEFYLAELIYMDLSLVFSADELAAMEEDLIYLMDEETLIRTPVAINVTDMQFVQDCLSVTEEDAAFLAFVGTAERAEEYHDFWEYLMAWEGMPEE